MSCRRYNRYIYVTGRTCMPRKLLQNTNLPTQTCSQTTILSTNFAIFIFNHHTVCHVTVIVLSHQQQAMIMLMMILTYTNNVLTANAVNPSILWTHMVLTHVLYCNSPHILAVSSRREESSDTSKRTPKISSTMIYVMSVPISWLHRAMPNRPTCPSIHGLASYGPCYRTRIYCTSMDPKYGS